MSFQKKVMILSDVKTGVGSGILRFVNDGGNTFFNASLHVDDLSDATLLLRLDNRILSFKAESGEKNLGDLSLSDNIDCVIAKNGKILHFGTTGNDKYRCFNLLADFEKEAEKRKNNASKNMQKTVENSRNDDDISDFSSDIETAETARFNADDTLSFSAEIGKDEGFRIECATSSAPDFPCKNNFSGNDFYLAVKPQLDEMFICFPADSALENAVPNSKWVRVNSDDENYVVGLIYNLDEVEYVCYGVPYEKKSPPPDEIKNVCDWLPLTDDENGKGYYLIYQSAKTGKTMKKEDFE